LFSGLSTFAGDETQSPYRECSFVGSRVVLNAAAISTFNGALEQTFFRKRMSSYLFGQNRDFAPASSV
jgi:hypothetical protein